MRSKVGEFNNSIILDAPWALWMNEVLEILHERPAGSSVWNFTYSHLVKEFQESSRRLGVTVVPYQCRHSGASHDRAAQLRPLFEVQKRGQWKSDKSVMRYEKAGRLAQTFAMYPLVLQGWIESVAPHHADILLGRRSVPINPPPFA